MTTLRTQPPAAAPAAEPVDVDDVCTYCGRFQTEAQAEQRTAEHVQADLLAVHRTRELLGASFGLASPCYPEDVYDLLCELDALDRAVLADDTSGRTTTTLSGARGFAASLARR